MVIIIEKKSEIYNIVYFLQYLIAYFSIKNQLYLQLLVTDK